jgi:hypothetical protein
MSMENLSQNIWHINIHHMLQRIPSIADNNLHSYFELISKKLHLHNTLKDVPALLELVMWKLMIIRNYDENDIFDILSADDKTKCQVESLLMVRKIVPKVLSFVTADEYTSAYQSSWMCAQCIYMNDEDISKAIFGDTNEGSQICVMCGAYRQH